MASTAASDHTHELAKSLSIDTMEAIINFVHTRLVDEDWKLFHQMRDDALRSKHMMSPHSALALQQDEDRRLTERWHGLLRVLQEDLPELLSTKLSELREKAHEESSRSALTSARLTPPAGVEDVDVPDASDTDEAVDDRRRHGSLNPRAPVAMMLSQEGSIPFSQRSWTMPQFEPHPQDHHIDMDADAGLDDADAGVDEFGSTSVAAPATDKTSTKRARNDDNPHQGPKKKKMFAKRSIKKKPRAPGGPNSRAILLSRTKEGEYIFKRDGWKHLYVLRCTMNQCTDQHGHFPQYTEHPFVNDLYKSHFSGPGHNLRGEEQVFRKWGHRVLNAREEGPRRMTSTAKQPEGSSITARVDDPEHVASSGAGSTASHSADGMVSPPTSPRAYRDKGKQPEVASHPQRLKRFSEIASGSSTSLGGNRNHHQYGMVPPPLTAASRIVTHDEESPPPLSPIRSGYDLFSVTSSGHDMVNPEASITANPGTPSVVQGQSQSRTEKATTTTKAVTTSAKTANQKQDNARSGKATAPPLVPNEDDTFMASEDEDSQDEDLPELEHIFKPTLRPRPRARPSYRDVPLSSNEFE
ncbi:hypothetical protein F4778DRAFT_483286 [Xylariomycetidae sp. FL2044]|nr:hypothetical protein F4778DRAFT_483286 [Xylariomycetidae sp. FL2044]